MQHLAGVACTVSSVDFEIGGVTCVQSNGKPWEGVWAPWCGVGVTGMQCGVGGCGWSVRVRGVEHEASLCSVG